MAFIVADKHVRYRDIANMFPIRDELLGRHRNLVSLKFSQPPYLMWLNSASELKCDSCC